MVRQVVWYCAITFLLLVSGYYAVHAAAEALFLYQLDESTEAVVQEWGAQEGVDGYYYPYARFTYEVRGKTYENRSFYSSSFARNPYALEPVLRDLVEKPMRVFFAAKNPQLSRLEKNYPYKEGLKATIALVVALYFFVLQRKRRLA